MIDPVFRDLIIEKLEREIFIYRGIIFLLVLTISYFLAK